MRARWGGGTGDHDPQAAREGQCSPTRLRSGPISRADDDRGEPDRGRGQPRDSGGQSAARQERSVSGRSDVLAEALDILREGYEIAGARQLFHNRSEVTVYLKRRR